MSEAGAEGARAFELLGLVVDTVGHEAVAQLLAVAEGEWAHGRPGPVAHSAEGVDPPYAISFKHDQVGYRLGVDTATLPVAALRGLVAQAAERT
jgi:hypothetical protein